MTLGETLDVRLIDQRVAPTDLGSSVVAPIKEGVDHHRAGREGSAVGIVALVGVVKGIAPEGVVPLWRALDCFGIGIEQ